MVLDRVNNGQRLCVMEVLNGWIGNRIRGDITRAFGVSVENENGMSVEDVCA